MLIQTQRLLFEAQVVRSGQAPMVGSLGVQIQCVGSGDIDDKIFS